MIDTSSEWFCEFAFVIETGSRVEGYFRDKVILLFFMPHTQFLLAFDVAYKLHHDVFVSVCFSEKGRNVFVSNICMRLIYWETFYLCHMIIIFSFVIYVFWSYISMIGANYTYLIVILKSYFHPHKRLIQIFNIYLWYIVHEIYKLIQRPYLISLTPRKMNIIMMRGKWWRKVNKYWENEARSVGRRENTFRD